MPDDSNITDTTISQSVTERGLGSKVIPGHLIINPDTEKGKLAHWYVVHTYSGHEARVAETLRQRVATLGQTDKVFEVLIPTQDKIQIRHGKKSSVKEKIFPGYLLIKMILDDDSWLVVRTTAGVTGFVGIGSKPTPFPVLKSKLLCNLPKWALPNTKPISVSERQSKSLMAHLLTSWVQLNLSTKLPASSGYWFQFLAAKPLLS